MRPPPERMEHRAERSRTITSPIAAPAMASTVRIRRSRRSFTGPCCQHLTRELSFASARSGIAGLDDPPMEPGRVSRNAGKVIRCGTYATVLTASEDQSMFPVKHLAPRDRRRRHDGGMSASAGTERWHFVDRWYMVSGFSQVGPDEGFGLELEDVGPAPGRGVVLSAYYHDVTGEISIASRTSDPLPMNLIEQFTEEARRRIRPVGHDGASLSDITVGGTTRTAALTRASASASRVTTSKGSR